VTLVLQAVEVRGPSRWRWLLTDEGTGNPLADYEVALDADAAEVRAFGDVYRYVREYAAPDRRAEDERRLVAELGVWAGATLLGERIGEQIVAAAPVTVRVTAGFRRGVAAGASAREWQAAGRARGCVAGLRARG
jgi:hypothetical protein